MTAKELKQTIRSEIERRKEQAGIGLSEYEAGHENGICELCDDLLSFINSLPDEPVDVEAAMKNLDEKIKLTKERGSWKGVDVDEFMEEIRGIKSVYIEKTARVSPGMLTNFGNSTFVLDVELTQAEQEKVFGGVPGVFSGTIKILLPCE